MTTVLFDADAPGDTALENSHWVAERTADVLGEDVATIRGEGVTRSEVEGRLADTTNTGFAYFGHGRDAALATSAGPVLDLQNLHAIGARWFHAFACNSGNGLAMTARRERVGAYLGYNRPVVVEWTVADLPAELEAILREIVTVATRRLADGERRRAALW